MKRTPLRRKKGLAAKRTEDPDDATEDRQWSTMPKVNKARAAKRRLRDFGGPYGDVLIPRLPCCVCFPWWYLKTDEELREAFADVLFDPERFAVVSEPAHVTHSRGAGGEADALCPMCHQHHICELHVMGVETFAAAYPENHFPATASRLWRIYQPFKASEDA